MTAVSFVAIVVLFRTAPDASATLRTLAACRSLDACARLVVVDHSPERQDDAFGRVAETFGRQQCLYLHDARNPPLGAAYNAALRAHLGDADYALILDQDTRLPVEFVAIALSTARANALPSVMAPHMLAGSRIASPCRLLLGWGRRWPEPRPGWQSLRANTLINSGAWIQRRVFFDLGVWYSETLPLYGTDTDLFRRLGRFVPRLFVLPVQVPHDLSFDSASVDEKIVKVEAMLAANRTIYAADAWPTRLGLRCINALVRLRYALRYRTMRFL